MDKKALFKKYRKLLGKILKVCNNISLKKNIRGENNKIIGLGGILLKKVEIDIRGNGNTIIFGEMSQIYQVNITIYGDNNVIEIGERNYLLQASFAVEDSNNTIKIGDHTYIYNHTEIAVMEGTSLIFGEDCLLSSDITIRTGDSHRIESVKTGERLNLSEDIVIGNHVWIGKRAMILKGVRLGSGSIVAGGAIVTSGCPDTVNVVVGGNPARILRQGCTWQHIRE